MCVCVCACNYLFIKPGKLLNYYPYEIYSSNDLLTYHVWKKLSKMRERKAGEEERDTCVHAYAYACTRRIVILNI